MHCSSASGMEALDASRAEVLTAAGHNVKSSWCLAKWPSRGQLASTRRIVAEHFEWLVLQDCGKPTWVCKHSTWTNQMRGFVRPMETHYVLGSDEAKEVFDHPWAAESGRHTGSVSAIPREIYGTFCSTKSIRIFAGTGPKFQLVFINLPASIWMDVSENRGTPKSSILTGFSIINHPFWGTTIFGNIHIP